MKKSLKVIGTALLAFTLCLIIASLAGAVVVTIADMAKRMIVDDEPFKRVVFLVVFFASYAYFIIYAMKTYVDVSKQVKSAEKKLKNTEIKKAEKSTEKK